MSLMLCVPSVLEPRSTLPRRAVANSAMRRRQPTRRGTRRRCRGFKWARLRAWIALCMAVVGDPTTEGGTKQTLKVYKTGVKSVAQLATSALACQLKKTFNQNGLNTDM
ncbi:unnamed protein product [Prorocentrum cordatum]|uniref:Uncharacterized protein n=1 Tax=Prorocentrum cordatum TaxID=2364126 RepID=A0ABN9Y5E6_9DINO|nr:unnamed protein product [Polarella glacialis]